MTLIYKTNLLTNKDIILLINKDSVVVSFWMVTPIILEKFLNDHLEISDWEIHDSTGINDLLEAPLGPTIAVRSENGLLPSPEFQKHIKQHGWL